MESVFGANFVVYDLMGNMLTTTKNARLYCDAQILLENLHLYDAAGLAHALAQLREDANYLLQSEYERSIWRKKQYESSSENDFTAVADSH